VAEQPRRLRVPITIKVTIEVETTDQKKTLPADIQDDAQEFWDDLKEEMLDDYSA
jgi:hypothetical protein